MLTKERISGTFVDIYKQKEKILINLSQYLQKQVSILGEKFFVVWFPLNMHPLEQFSIFNIFRKTSTYWVDIE